MDLINACYTFPCLPLIYITYVFFYEMLILTTVSKVTRGRFLQLIHVKRSTVLDSNEVVPPTAVVWPMITDLTRHYAVCDRGMRPIYPSWGMRTTTPHAWTISGHPSVVITNIKAIPAGRKIIPIASDWTLTSVSGKAVGSIEGLEVTAWVLVSWNCYNNGSDINFDTAVYW